jgi:Fe-S oxidoreductase
VTVAEPLSLDARLEALTSEDLERALAVFRGSLRESEAAGLNACVRCGLCAESCHYFLSDRVPENVPAAKLGEVAAVFRRRFTAAGKLLPALVGAKEWGRGAAAAWLDAAFGRCSLCGRCSLNCAVGINIPAVLRAARGALASVGIIPDDLRGTVTTALSTGNNMGISKEDFLETVAWLEEELQTESGDPSARIPVDREGAEFLFTVNPREPKFFPLSLLASARVFHAAGASWTLPSEGWDLTNYGLFSGEAEAGAALARMHWEAARRLKCRTLVLGECGHGFAAERWEGPEWLGEPHPFGVIHILELMDRWLEEGRLTVDPARTPKRVTLHDPCNLVRHGGIREPQRRILRRAVAEFAEMTPHGEENFCCGGGGGQLGMARYRDRRIRSGSIKADQIRRSGAAIVATPCHNCIDQLGELNKEYKLAVQIKSVAEIVADALVPTPSSHEVTR